METRIFKNMKNNLPNQVSELKNYRVQDGILISSNGRLDPAETHFQKVTKTVQTAGRGGTGL